MENNKKNFSGIYGYMPDIDKINLALDAIAKNVESGMTENVLKKCFSFMDLTSLKNEDTPLSIAKLVDKVNAFSAAYPSYPQPASICVFPNFAGQLAKGLKSKEVHTTVVAGCFPASQSYVEVKALEAEMAVKAGADEVDIVLALNSFLAGDYDKASDEIRQIRAAIDKAAAGRSVCLKVILETGILSDPAMIADASFLAMEAGADFIKTSTGKVSVNATPMAAYVMCECIGKFYEKTGRKVGFKAAGGLSTASDAVGYYLIVSSLLGEDWLDKSLFRLGVSRLANSLLSALEKETINFF